MGFAAVRAFSAFTQVTNPRRQSEFPKLDILAATGLLAQLAVLCIHVVTTTHASRTVIAGFAGTILSSVVQTWHLVHKNKSSNLRSDGFVTGSRLRTNTKYGRSAKRALNFAKRNASKQY